MNDLRGSRVLVTGGAGLVGSHIVDALIKEDASVVVYDNLIRGEEENLTWAKTHGCVELFDRDIRDAAALNLAMEGIDYVFHEAAAWLRMCEEEPRLSLDVNVVGTFNVLEACVAAGVKKIVVASSSSVYGEGLYLPTDEHHPFNNDLFYGASKVALEQFCRAFYQKYRLNYVGFRYLNVFGPRQPFGGAYTDVIGHFLNQLYQGLPPIVRGDGSATLDLVYVTDVARANVMAMMSDVTDEVLNVASGKETTVKELAETLIRLTHKDGEIEPTYQAMDVGLVTRRWGDPTRARDILGFEVTTQVEEGLKRVIQWREERK